ncbi:MAG: amino acid adenylation domain-containing protein [Bacteroidota bacterium]
MEQLIKKLRKNNIRLKVKDNQLDVHFDGPAIPDDILQSLRANKVALIDYIQSKSVQKEYVDIPIVPQQDSYPLSSSQHRSWLLSQFEEANPAYNMPIVLVFKGDLDRALLQQTFDLLIERHEVMRTVFKDDENGDIRQYILSPEAINIKIEYLNLVGVEDQEATIEPIVLEDITQPFDLYHGPLVRARLIQTHSDRYVFDYVMHHIIGDAMSGDIVRKEIALLYYSLAQGLENPLPPLRIQYKDYASWQQSELNGPQKQKEKAYWLDQFTGEIPALQMATDKARPAVKTYNGTRIFYNISKDRIDRLKKLSEDNSCTLFMSIIGLVNTLLHHYSGQQDIILGSPISGRNHVDLKKQVGFYINTLAIRTQFTETESFTDLLAKIKKTMIGAYQHQMYSFDELVNQLNLKRDLSRNPLFDVFVIMQGTEKQYGEEAQELEGIQILPYKGTQDVFSYFDLTLIFADEEEFKFTLEYNSDIFYPETADRLGKHFIQMIDAILDQPNAPIHQLDFLKKEEKQQLLEMSNHSDRDYSKQRTFIDLFRQKAIQRAHHPALFFEDTQLTYQELDEQSNQLAHHLTNKGIQNGDLIALCLDRSVEMVVSLLALVKIGAAYIPIDPHFPAERIQYIIEDANTAWVISQEKYQDSFEEQQQIIFVDQEAQTIAQQSKSKIKVDLQPEQLVYLIYTSGSTGKPKGVMVEHRSLLNFLYSMEELLDFTEQSSLLALTTYGFDIAYLELFLPLICGGSLVVASSEVTADGFFLQELIAEHRPSHMQATPATWQLLMDCDWSNQEKVIILSGGEAIKESLKNQLTALSDQKVWNLYGPTETTIWSTAKVLKAAEKVNIGRPIANTQIYILDTRQGVSPSSLVPFGVSGELCIGGAGLARAYLDRPDLTAQKFVAHPFRPGERLYRTGDLAKWLPNGDIECLGRIDDQVKVRGYRIEPGEIETLLQKQAEIKQAIVVAREDKIGSNRLIAYVLQASEGELDKAKVQLALKAQLPGYMLPSIYVALDEFPMTPNGKIDKKALPDPNAEAIITQEYVAPRNEIETQLIEIWNELLGLDKIGIQDDFFQLGGHSLLATRVISSVKKQFSIKLPIRVLFEKTTVAELAHHLEQIKAEEEVSFDNKLII